LSLFQFPKNKQFVSLYCPTAILGNKTEISGGIQKSGQVGAMGDKLYEGLFIYFSLPGFSLRPKSVFSD
jgi:hypothetical protein